jgi:hypothetical protein
VLVEKGALWVNPNSRSLTALKGFPTIRRGIDLVKKGRRFTGLTVDELRYRIDGIFDAKYGTNTSRIIQLKELRINGKNVIHGVFYEPTPVRLFRHAMKNLQICYQEFTFIDFGSGKGRNLLLASDYPFSEIIGVEFSFELHSIAVNNIAIYGDRRRKCSAIRSFCADAAEYPLPTTNLIAFFFNPFDEIVFAEILSNMRDLSKERHKLCIVYCEARCSLLIENSGLFPYRRQLEVPYLFTIRSGWISSLNVYANFPLV